MSNPKILIKLISNSEKSDFKTGVNKNVCGIYSIDEEHLQFLSPKLVNIAYVRYVTLIDNYIVVYNDYSTDCCILSESIKIEDYFKKKDNIYLENMVSINGLLLQYIENQTHSLCLKAVNNNGYALKYVKKQTNSIIFKAIKNNPRAITHVIKQKYKFCAYVINRDPYAIILINNPTYKMYCHAINKDIEALDYITNQTNNMCRYAINKNIEAIPVATPVIV